MQIVQRIIRRPLHIFEVAVATIAGLLVCGVIGAIFISWLGIYNVAATAEHTPPFAWFLHFTMRNSVKAHARRTPVPSLKDPRLLAMGKTFAELRCAPCHGDQSRSPDISATKLLPKPPPLATLAHDFNDNEVHWIIKHGVKMSGMPAWPTQQRDDEIWPLVAYLKKVEKNPGIHSDEGPRGGSGLGGEVTITTCFACHGSDGDGRQGVFPKLAGLSKAYIQNSLKAYRSEVRPSGFMEPFAHDLSDDDIANFASYFGGLSRSTSRPKAIDQKQIAQGARIAEPGKSTRGQIACLACHTQTNPKAFADIPDLAGQSEWYIENQLQLFRAGTRSGTANSNIMARIAKGLSDEDIRAVSAYFASLQPNGQS